MTCILGLNVVKKIKLNLVFFKKSRVFLVECFCTMTRIVQSIRNNVVGSKRF